MRVLSTTLQSRILLFSTLLALAATGARAQGVLAIKPVFFHLDSVRHLILINAPLSELNAGTDTLKAIQSGNRQYVLSQPTVSVSTSQAYRASTKDATYAVYFTRIPVLHIDTRYQIVDAPSVYARFALADTSGVLAQSAMGIEVRGAFSQNYPKKSYELSLWADTAGVTDQDVALLGMRNDNKWNLQAMYNDPLRLRIKLANEVWQDMDQPYYQAQEPAAKSGIALAYTEVFLNNSYQGIYALTERVDRKQLKLKKYTAKIMGELYKGTDGAGGALTFNTVPAFDNASTTWGGFEYKEPAEETNWTALHDFVDFVVTSSDADFYSQYQRKFNLGNAVDYFIFLNLMRASDNTGKNIYIAKYKPNEPYYYVPWDLDGVLGNDWRGVNVATTDDLLTNGFYTRLLKDTAPGGFRATLASRWQALRASVLTQEAILRKLSRNSNYLLASNAYEREHLAWVEYQYDATQLAYPADWLARRLAYLDSMFSVSNALAASQAASAAPLQLYPNPASAYFSIAVGPAPCQLSIRNLTGTTVLQKTLAGGASQVDISALPPGMYVACVKNATATITQKLLVR